MESNQPRETTDRQVCQTIIDRQLQICQHNQANTVLSQAEYDSIPTDDSLKAMLAPAFQDEISQHADFESEAKRKRDHVVYVRAQDDEVVETFIECIKNQMPYADFITCSGEAAPVLLRLAIGVNCRNQELFKINLQQFIDMLHFALYRDWLMGLNECYSEQSTNEEHQKTIFQLATNPIVDANHELSPYAKEVIRRLCQNDEHEIQKFTAYYNEHSSKLNHENQLILLRPNAYFTAMVFMQDDRPNSDLLEKAKKQFGDDFDRQCNNFGFKNTYLTILLSLNIAAGMLISSVNRGVYNLLRNFSFIDNQLVMILPSATMMRLFGEFKQTSVQIEYRLGPISAQDMLDADDNGKRLVAVFLPAKRTPSKGHGHWTPDAPLLTHDYIYHQFIVSQLPDSILAAARYTRSILTRVQTTDEPKLTQEIWRACDKEIPISPERDGLESLILFGIYNAHGRKNYSLSILFCDMTVHPENWFGLLNPNNQRAILKTVNPNYNPNYSPSYHPSFSRKEVNYTVEPILGIPLDEAQQLIKRIYSETSDLALTSGLFIMKYFHYLHERVESILQLVQMFPELLKFTFEKSLSRLDTTIIIELVLGDKIYYLSHNNNIDNQELIFKLATQRYQYVKLKRPVEWNCYLKNCVLSSLSALQPSGEPRKTFLFFREKAESELPALYLLFISKLPFEVLFKKLEEYIDSVSRITLKQALAGSLKCVNDLYCCYLLAAVVESSIANFATQDLAIQLREILTPIMQQTSITAALEMLCKIQLDDSSELSTNLISILRNVIKIPRLQQYYNADLQPLMKIDSQLEFTAMTEQYHQLRC